MYREILRLKAKEDFFEEFKTAVKDLSIAASRVDGCNIFIPYLEVNNEGWIFVDTEFDTVESFHKMFESEEIRNLDANMKQYISDGISCVLEEY